MARRSLLLDVMLAIALSASLIGLDASLVRVEVEVARGIPLFELVGLAEVSVRESRVRVKSALAQLGIDLSEYRVIVNLAPADVRKYGGGFDLAIAAATLVAVGAAPPEALEHVVFLGELSLAGGVHGVRGVLPKLLGMSRFGARRAIVAKVNEAEAALVTSLDVRVVQTLGELAEAMCKRVELPRACAAPQPEVGESLEDLADVRGQAGARRALEICAAGAHNLLMIGPPGAGKTMLARRMPSLLPPLSPSESLEVSAIHSVAGLLRGVPLISRVRPFRAPHHTVSEAGLVGGGDVPRPGEVSLAHHGVLFLDELPEFRRAALESLRQPLEDGVITVSRSQGRATFPARPLVVGAMNPCTCGFFGDPTGRCACPPERIRMYRSRLSGPLLDRIDVHVRLPPVSISALQHTERGEGSAAVRERVQLARLRQRERQKEGLARSHINASLTARDLERVAHLGLAAERILSRAAESLGLSARAYGKVLRVARTIADLDAKTDVGPEHVAEAVSLRVLDRRPDSAAAA